MSYGQNNTDKSEGWICQGELHGRALDSNDKPLDKAESFGSISSAVMNLEIVSKPFKNNKNQTSKNVIIEKNSKLSLNFRSLHKENFAKFVYAEVNAEPAVSGYTITTTASLGNSFVVDGIIEGNVIIKDETDTVTFVEGEDYRVSNGTIECIKSGDISESQSLNVTYDKAGTDVYEGLIKDDLVLWLTFDAVNISEMDQPIKTTFFKCSFSPAAQINILSAEDFAETSIEVECLASNYIFGSSKSKIFKQERRV